MNTHTEELDIVEDVELQEEEKEYVRRTFEIEEGLVELMEREAYWDRKTNKEVLNDALAAYFKKKKPKPLPKTFKKVKRGRKPQ